MSSIDDDPNVKKIADILDDPSRRQFVSEIIKHKEIKFVTLFKDVLKFKETTARHHLTQLESSGLVLKKKSQGSRAMLLTIHPKYINRI